MTPDYLDFLDSKTIARARLDDLFAREMVA